jgi:hypothetical protein
VHHSFDSLSCRELGAVSARADSSTPVALLQVISKQLLESSLPHP